MKKFLVSLLLFMSIITYAQDRVVTIAAGGLEEALAGDYAFKRLTISGVMDARDFACIHENATGIIAIDLSGCEVVAYDSRDEQYMGYHTHFESHAIPASAFFGFTSLEKVVLPQGVTAIGDGAFAGCESLTSVEGVDKIVLIGDYAFSGCSKLSEYAFSSTLQRVGDYAFDKCSALADIDMSVCTSLSYIGVRAFAQNTSLITVVFPPKVSTINDAAFAGCCVLSQIEMPQVENCGVGVFAACTSLERVDMSQTSLQELPAWTFSGCTVMTDILLSDSMKAIREGAFYYCESLSMAALPMGVEYLDDFTFAGCNNLQSITFLPEGMESIGRYAFYQNITVDSVILPVSVSYIGDHAFDGCINANNFETMREMPAELGEMVFANMEVEHKTLSVLSESVVVYESTAQWQDFGTIECPSALEDVVVRDDIKAIFEQYNLVVKSEQPMREVRLYDISGMLLAHSTQVTNEVVVDTKSFASNIYLLQVVTSDGHVSVTKVARVIR